jgi:hypothetical protein
MKASRSYLAVIGILLGVLCVSNFISLAGYFQAVENSGSGGVSEKRLLAQLQYMHAQLKATEDPEVAKRQIRTFESTLSDGEALDKLRKTYAPVQAVYSSKPKEAEDRYLLVRKRELMEGLVNAYRKEIPNGLIPVRAAYLNILFDLQNSLLNENAETEEVFIRRNKERFAALKAIVAKQADQGLSMRVANLDSIFLAYERGFDLTEKWREHRTEMLASAEKALPNLARESLGTKDSLVDGLRRSFLYACILALVAGVVGFVVLFVCHKMLKLRFYGRSDAFLRILKDFGRERTDPSYEKDLNLLQSDPDWADLIHGAVESETDFVAKYQALLAVPKSLQTPYVVFSKDRSAKHWNGAAEELFGLNGESAPSLDEIICEEKISSREESVAIVDMVRNSFPASKEEVFEILLSGNAPYELLSYPVISGPLAGGKLFVFRSIRSETNRIDKAVSEQLAKVRTYVHKISHHYPVDIAATDHDSPEVKETLTDLDTMKRKIDEREILWKSETTALLDQVSRQREILEKLAGEIRQIREAHGTALELVGSIQVSDEDWHGEICLLDKELAHWKSLRARLESELGQHNLVLAKARAFEQEVRISAEDMEGFLSAYDATLEELKAFGEEAQLQAVNMAFAKEPKDFSARCRAYSVELNRFVELAGKLSGRVRSFIGEHPAGALAAHLESTDLDPSLIEGLKREEERISQFVSRWKEEGGHLVTGGGHAMELLRQADKKSAVVNQLGETSLLINDQAKSNLQRWN